jgi:hypothetical protein
MKKLFIPILLFLIISAQAQTENQTDSLRKDAVKLFIDCSFCDMNYIRREIPYVNYVRDVKEAELYLRINSESTGSGGRQYSLIFDGQKKFEGMNDTLFYAARPDDTRDHRRQGRMNMMKMGLMRYVARTPVFKEVNINHSDKIEEEEVIDRWNNWVFELQTRPNYESEESRKEFRFDNSIMATKITPEWKLEFELEHELNRTKYTYDNETFIKDRTEIQFQNLVVKSLGEHWSVGNRLRLESSTFSNMKFNATILPSVEYDLFPYSESTHRQLRFLYGIGVSFNQYNDSTIFGKTEENLGQQQLQLAYQVQEKWGSVNVSLEGSNYLHDFSKYRIELDGYLTVRIIKGLSLSVYGGVAKINDQLSLKRGELSEADILLQLQELATAYSVDGGVGLTYTFGSIFNNVVNPRFGNGRRRYYR